MKINSFSFCHRAVIPHADAFRFTKHLIDFTITSINFVVVVLEEANFHNEKFSKSLHTIVLRTQCYIKSSISQSISNVDVSLLNISKRSLPFPQFYNQATT